MRQLFDEHYDEHYDEHNLDVDVDYVPTEWRHLQHLR